MIRDRGHWRPIARRVAIILAGVLALLAVVAGAVAWRVYHTLTETNPHPETATGLRPVEDTRAERFMVVAAHPEASRAGADILRRGGSAVDAAVAVQMVLTLVEPQSSGIGGGGFMLYYDANSGELHAYDGRETAPAGVGPEHFLDADGDAMPFPLAVVGGRAVGVPGVVRMLALAHRTHGALSWKHLFDRAIQLAEEGFVVTPRLARQVALDPILPTLAPTRDYFFPEGRAIEAGARLRNPALADVMSRLQEKGPEGFYEGPVARAMVAAVQGADQPTLARSILNLALTELGMAPGGQADRAAPGPLELRDLTAYRALEREPVCRGYREYRVCGFPPPTAGGISVLQILGQLERFDIAALEPSSPEALHLFVEAQKRAYADRKVWIADPDYVEVPTKGLLSPAYIERRSESIRRDAASAAVSAGRPPGAPTGYRSGPASEYPSTSHFTVVDADGNVVSMTTSLEFGFGSHTMTRGFFLNNQLTDFSFTPRRDGEVVANAPAGGKRPRSSMSPTIVFHESTGAPVLALGSPGGIRIISYVARALIGVLDWDLHPNDAAALPHAVNLGEETEIEDVGWPTEAARAETVDALEALGHEVSLGSQNSGLHIVRVFPDRLVAGIDPRREGLAVGE